MTTTATELTATELTTVAPSRWSLDRDGSSVGFTVKTMWGLIPVRGRFDRFAGSYEVGPNGTTIELTIDAASIDTGNAKRDEHLRSSDFFDVDDHPYVRFRSTRVHTLGDGMLHVVGNLEVAGIVEPLEFAATRAACRRGARGRGDDDRRSAAVRHEQRLARDDSPARDAARQGAAGERRRWATLP